MSDDRRPAKVRVVSASPVEAGLDALSPQGTPARRRSDRPEAGEEEQVAAAILAGSRRRGGVAGSLAVAALFLVGCALGGALFVLSGFAGPVQP
ncbi:hypothetical protein [Novosphingobium resinovorum]|uniref:hypothetical protein n=1 Tax=Novosphingobium resinovorum TaxID=158500 RepID=UPI002ED0A27C|nr:hypothetical protein [Novosphingobium resinovorum]